jgi:hypothetical protein
LNGAKVHATGRGRGIEALLCSGNILHAGRKGCLSVYESLSSLPASNGILTTRRHSIVIGDNGSGVSSIEMRSRMGRKSEMDVSSDFVDSMHAVSKLCRSVAVCFPCRSGTDGYT